MNKQNSQIRQMLIDWKNDKNIQKLKEFYNTKSFSEILKVEKNEMSHSSFLAWILDRKQNHQLGEFGVRQLLDILLATARGQQKLMVSLEKYNAKEKDSLLKSFILGNYIITNMEIELEKALDTKQRLDIFISIDFKMKDDESNKIYRINIVLENKVESKEHNGQTQSYYTYFSEHEKYKNDLNIFVYLTPNNDEPVSSKFIKISYQQIADSILEKALTQEISTRTACIIKEYLLSLRKPLKQGNIMAIGQFEKDLLKDFWEMNEDLLNTAFSVLAEINKGTPEGENFQKILDATGQIKRDHTKYLFEDDSSPLSKNKLALAVVKKYINDHADKTFDELQAIFTEIRPNMLVYVDDTTDYKEDEVFEIDGQTYTICKGWSANQIFENLKSFAKKNGYKIAEVQ